MSDEKKHFYAKFKIDEKRDVMDGFMISESSEIIEGWTTSKDYDKEEADEGKDLDERNEFQTVAINFDRSISAFQSTVPFIMKSLPFILQFSDDRALRGIAKKNGRLLNGGEYETYELDIGYLAEFAKNLEETGAIRSGINSVPSMFLVGLVSAYDVFLSQLIRAMFVVKPELLSSSERNISFKDLVEIGSVDEARNRIIEKEVEAVIRSSHADQIGWLESKLKISLRKDLKIWPEFIELCERRNLLTHTGGVISSQYMAVCKEHGAALQGKAIGQKLNIGPKYYARAVEIIMEFGIKLTQVVWRKLVPNDINIAASDLDRRGYSLIARRKYKLAVTILRFALYEMPNHGTDDVRKRTVINYCNALKLSGEKAKAEETLNLEDWTASTDNYRICVAAIKDDVECVTRLMKRVVNAELMKVSDFREWPVFEGVRADPKFIDAFEQAFGQKLLLDRETTTDKALSENGLEADSASDSPTAAAAETPPDPTIH